MSFFVVDVESDGPAPGLYSMISFGAVKVDMNLKTTFYGETKPISECWIPESLAISNIDRNTHLQYPEPQKIMEEFSQWVLQNSVGKPVFISDNLGFDWSFMNYYFHAYVGSNPFGFSGRRINDFYSGIVKDLYASSKWKKFRKTKHTHNPVDDAVGNAEAFIHICKTNNIKVPL